MGSDFLPVLTGSFSTPARDNPTVEIVEASYRATGFHGRYINCEVGPDNLAAAVHGARAQGWRGFNCSLPHKIPVVELLHELTPQAAAIGAVNCVAISKGGRLVGDNTDGRGFLHALKQSCDPADANVVVLGAGGAARAVAVELALAGARSMTIVNRSQERAAGVLAALAGLVSTVKYEPWGDTIRVDGAADILVNATSVGLAPNDRQAPPVDFARLSKSAVVADLIPNPPQTPFLRKAAVAGFRTIDGRGMLINQAAIAVEWWTGRPADIQAMHAALDAATAGNSGNPASK